jgi:uncharacterized protein
VSLRSGSFPQVLWAAGVVPSEQDCACPGTSPAPAVTSALDASPWRISSHLHYTSLPGAHELVFNPTGPAGVVVLNETARCVLNVFFTPSTPSEAIGRFPGLPSDVVHSAIHRLAALRLIQPANQPANQPILYPSETLTAWLHVTSRCNLRCAYCYVPRGGEAMDAETGRAAVDAAFRSATGHGFRAVKLKYAGGEPTLNFPVVQAIHTHAQAVAAETGLGLREVILSNGVALTQEMLDWLCDEDVRLAISLDGVGESHDGQRALPGGESSYSCVARAVDRALASGVTPHISITVTSRNVDALDVIVGFALQRDLLFNLNFVRPVPAGPDLAATPERLITGVRAAMAVVEARMPRLRLIDGLLDRCNLTAPHGYPCGAGHSYLVVDPHGRVARCQMEMERTVSSVWEDDPLQMVRTAPEGFRNLSVDEKEGCRECPWQYWCAGGCPLVARRMSGRQDVRSPYCKVYRTLLPELLRLEALRLLKWQPLLN